MTSNPVLRQKVRLLALTKALRRVSEGRVSQDVANTSESFIVDWETGVSIYSRESREFNRCTIHVQCEAYRHSIWESWTEDKIFTRLSRAALMKSFANQCKRLSHASMLAMRQMLMQAAREKKGTKTDGFLKLVFFPFLVLPLTLFPNFLCFEAAMMIQRQARKFVKVKSFQRVRKSVLCFQALWRMTRQLREYALLNRSACVIQAFYRVYAAETKYLEFLAGLVRLQARSRGIIQRKIKATRVACATKIEALFRGSSARCFYAQNTKACTTIQSWYRGITLYRCYSRMRKVHETLQALARRRLILHQIKQEESVIKLQSWWRRLAWSSYYVSLLRCVCMIQAMFRGFKVKQLYQKSLNDRLLVTNKKHIAFCSAILIQRWYRTMVNRVNLKAKIQRKVAQRYCNKLREETRAANKIQLWGEKVVATREVENRRQWSKARIIQAMVRGTVVRSRIQTQHEAARVIQHFFREFSSRQATIFNMKIEMAIRSRVNNQYIRQDTAASMLSDFSVDNVHDVKQHYQLCATMTFPVNNLKGSAIVIQAAYRAHLCKRRFSLLKASVRLIQSYWRTVLFERRALPIHADSCCLENASVGLDVVEVERTSWLKMVQSIAAST